MKHSFHQTYNFKISNDEKRLSKNNIYHFCKTIVGTSRRFVTYSYKNKSKI